VTPAAWTCPLPGGGASDEFALAFDHARDARLLIIPALFDEANKLRRLTVEVMRRLDAAGIDSVLPDLPGTNESLQPLAEQSLEGWRAAMAAAATHFGVTHVLAMRGGALVMPAGARGWRHAPAKGAAILRQMIRARILAQREAGVEETQEGLLTQAASAGLALIGYDLSPEMVTQLQSAQPAPSPTVSDINQDMLGGGGLWLRAEPGDSREQADALAAILAIGIRQ